MKDKFFAATVALHTANPDMSMGKVGSFFGVGDTTAGRWITEHYAARRAEKEADRLASMPENWTTTVTREMGSLQPYEEHQNEPLELAA